MAFQILLNFFLAFLWMFLQVSFDLKTFVIGYLLGLILIYGMRRFFKTDLYIRRVWAVIYLTLLFFKELIMANIDVLKVILKPKLDIQPGIFALPTELKSDWEITLLANLITLTPGTLVIDVSDDQKTLYVHAIDVPDVQDAINSIKESFEKAIMEVSRPC
ncbi:Na+/H+ antiporter subunit E [Bacillus badius]|uniref:Na(+) H(+) antiporter subunit E n=1 Tax=Bacillus badius TaxID=1455 RepID=A0ABR5AXT1_BACBA|nr:Na+/H+ antiporter subunit E [Bacillus badius]KIL75927.1 Na(+) H(+) antiporter subunit E [Bacillus badius]KIL79513.1 Na(+) H(+) antiporter subunit E [Bacillus badius]KZO00450.1 cation:proton antiporter [Bacillus badius]KZR59590.1 cation:proton antiporter [Bacillus badius]MED0667776.1 Na+/H+ antiporter subunit E [Bacillus badius]